MGKFGISELILLGFTSLIYFLPAIIAYNRKAADRVGILVLTLLTGWTGIGWIAALIWACAGKKEFNPLLYYTTTPSSPKPEEPKKADVPENFGQKYDNLQKLKELLDAGVISEEEFQAQKSRILN